MTNLTVTAAQVALVDPTKAVLKDFLAGSAITRGDVVAMATDGTIDPADASDGGGYLFEQVVGVAINAGGAGAAITVLMQGEMLGYTVSGLNCGAIVYLSDDAGVPADSQGTVLVRLGRVTALTDKGTTNVVHIHVDLAEALWVT